MKQLQTLTSQSKKFEHWVTHSWEARYLPAHKHPQAINNAYILLTIYSAGLFVGLHMLGDFDNLKFVVLAIPLCIFLCLQAVFAWAELKLKSFGVNAPDESGTDAYDFSSAKNCEKIDVLEMLKVFPDTPQWKQIKSEITIATQTHTLPSIWWNTAKTLLEHEQAVLVEASQTAEEQKYIDHLCAEQQTATNPNSSV